MKKAIGIDLGRDPVIGIFSNINGELLEKKEITFPLDVPFGESAKVLKQLINSLMHSDISGIGIGSPGWIDPSRGICHFAPNFPLWKNVNITKTVQERFHLPSFVLNDVNAGALGEKYFGAARIFRDNTTTPKFLEMPLSHGALFDASDESSMDVKNLLFITVGVGIGGGFIINNELHTGMHGGAGEIGHMTLEPDGPPCACGSWGCLESLCSMSAIRNAVDNGLSKGINTKLNDHISSAESLTFEILKECIIEKDEFSQDIMAVVGRYLGIGLSNLINIFDPHLIVIGGELVTLFDIIKPILMKEIEKRVKMFPMENIKIVPSKLGELSGAYGASAIVFKRLFNF